MPLLSITLVGLVVFLLIVVLLVALIRTIL